MAEAKKKGPGRPRKTDFVSRTRQGPTVPGAEDSPVVGQPDLRTTYERKKAKKQRRSKNEVEKSEMHTQQRVMPPSKLSAVARMNRLKELCEPLTPSLIQVMSDLAHDKKVHPAIRLDAADRLLDRVYGKPKEHVQIDGDDESVNPDEVFKLLNSILESVGAPLLEGPASES